MAPTETTADLGIFDGDLADPIDFEAYLEGTRAEIDELYSICTGLDAERREPDERTSLYSELNSCFERDESAFELEYTRVYDELSQPEIGFEGSYEEVPPIGEVDLSYEY